MKAHITEFLIIAISILFYKVSFSLPVELSSFTSSVNENNVSLEWQTLFETNNSGFYVERKSADSVNWNELGFVSGHGTTGKPQFYSYNDTGLSNGEYSYRLKQVDFNNNFQYHELSHTVIISLTSISNSNSLVPDNFYLHQNYPNPFNPVTKISYVLRVTNYVGLKVYDIAGKEVATLVNAVQNPGTHSVTFDASDLSSGTYFYKLESEGFSMVKRMMVVK